MALLIILLAVFISVALMVFFTQRFGKPMDAEQQMKFAKATRILVFVLLAVALLKALF